jgi:hypothetical protein
MKLCHIPAAFRHDQWFVVRHAPEMQAHTYRGCTLRSMLGREDERRAFERYKSYDAMAQCDSKLKQSLEEFVN